MSSRSKDKTHNRLADKTNSNERSHTLSFIGGVSDVVEQRRHELWPLVVRQFNRGDSADDLGSGSTDSFGGESSEYNLLDLGAVGGVECEPPLRLMQGSRLIPRDKRILNSQTRSLADKRLLGLVGQFIRERVDVRRVILAGCLFELFRGCSPGLLL